MAGYRVPLQDGRLARGLRSLRWLPPFAWQRLVRRRPEGGPVHVIIAVANHFEPEIPADGGGPYATPDERASRLDHWCREYPKMADPWRDADGRPLRHTYFYPAEHYDERLIGRLAEHCEAGWGEIEIHLHHGLDGPDTAENTRDVLVRFRDTLAAHGCLSRGVEGGPPRYAFLHGNWALANSAGGRFCGVDEEMQILAETGCYADFTLPSAPDASQIGKINALYECALPLGRRAPHRRGQDLRRGHQPRTFPLIIQGPLGVNFARRFGRWRVPCIENGALTASYPPSVERFDLWRRAEIGVKGCPDWIFIKLHCHGMLPADTPSLLGEPIQRFLREVTAARSGAGDYRLHFVTAREMVNMILAACDGRDGDPFPCRDYRFRTIASPAWHS